MYFYKLHEIYWKIKPPSVDGTYGSVVGFVVCYSVDYSHHYISEQEPFTHNIYFLKLMISQPN